MERPITCPVDGQGLSVRSERKQVDRILRYIRAQTDIHSQSSNQSHPFIHTFQRFDVRHRGVVSREHACDALNIMGCDVDDEVYHLATTLSHTSMHLCITGISIQPLIGMSTGVWAGVR